MQNMSGIPQHHELQHKDVSALAAVLLGRLSHSRLVFLHAQQQTLQTELCQILPFPAATAT